MSRTIRYSFICSVLHLLLAMLMPQASAQAETLYVKDSLRVGVRSQPGDSHPVIDVVVTGMKLDVLDTSGSFIKITGKAGQTGWIKRSYVDAEAPAIIKYEQLQQQYTALQARIAEQDKAAVTVKQAEAKLAQQLDELNRKNAQLQQELQHQQVVNQPAPFPYLWLLVLLLILTVSGFIAGVYWHRHMTMKRLGGLRV